MPMIMNIEMSRYRDTHLVIMLTLEKEEIASILHPHIIS